MAHGSRPLGAIKVFLCGDPGVGKSTIKSTLTKVSCYLVQNFYNHVNAIFLLLIWIRIKRVLANIDIMKIIHEIMTSIRNIITALNMSLIYSLKHNQWLIWIHLHHRQIKNISVYHTYGYELFSMRLIGFTVFTAHFNLVTHVRLP